MFSMIFSLIVIVLLVVLTAHYIMGAVEDENMIYSLWMLLVVVLLLFRYGGFEYVSVDFSNDEIDIKYYRLFPFNRKFNRIVISDDLLGDFKIQKGIGPLFSAMILFQNRSGAMAQYPPIGMAAVNSDMQRKLLEQFKKIMGGE